MKLLRKILPFWTIFSLVFFLLRIKDPFYGLLLRADISDLGGITYLYATVGTIFSILAGFIIGNRWDRWNQLAVAVKGEAAALHELWSWSQRFPKDAATLVREAIRRYLALTIRHGWEPREARSEDAAEDTALAELRTGVQEALQQPSLAFTVSSMFGDFLKHRSARLQNLGRMPEGLRQTLIVATALVIGLSLFIAVKNIWLDYLFTLSVSLLAYLIFLVVDDLDNPLQPGIWHLTPRDYEELLAKLQPRRPETAAPTRRDHST